MLSSHSALGPHMRLIATAGLMSLAVLGCDNQSEQSPTEPGANDSPALAKNASKKVLIAFTSERDGDSEIYAMTSDGKKQTRLTTDPGFDFNPSWSPGHTKIAFVSFPQGGVDANIFVMNADGSGRTQLTSNPEFEDHPTWSPDGTRIAFERNGVLVIMNADGTNQTVVPHGDQDSDAQPDWSPDGTRLAFTRVQNFNRDQDIWVENLDGTGATKLTPDDPETEAFRDFRASWSPDGRKIAFVSNRSGIEQIYVMNADGTGQTKVTSTGINDDVTWSPDGSKLAIQHFEADNYDIYTMNADGSGATRLTTSAALDYAPSWAP